MRSFFISIITVSLLLFWNQGTIAQVKIDPLIEKNMTELHQSSVIINLKPLLLSELIPTHLNKDEKGTLAYNLLKKHFDQESSELIKILNKHRTSYRTYIITASVYVPSMNSSLYEEIKKLPSVHQLISNPHNKNVHVLAATPEADNRKDYTWGLKITNTHLLHEMGIYGQNVTIGGNDTGFDWTHPAIKNSYRGWNQGQVDHNYNWHDAIHENSPMSSPNSENPCGLSIKEPCDDNSHGTHTMGTMTGITPDSLVIGMAPGANWVAVRNMERGNGSLQAYIEAFEWFLAPTDSNYTNPDPLKSPHVINNSWYCSVEEGCNATNWELMRIAVTNLKAAGVAVVVSAGNAGPGCNTISFVPAMLDEVLSVGATASNDTIANFSSRGMVNADGSMRMKPDVSAPGVGVYSGVLNHGYANYSGTSMAGPHVAGLVALMISANPQLAGHVDTIFAMIRNTAIPKTGSQDCDNQSGLDVPNPIYGYGRINALAAVQAAQAFSTIKKDDYISNQLIFAMSPNPNNGMLAVHWDEMINRPSLQLFNTHGQLVYHQLLHANGSSIDLSHLPAGTYFARLTDQQKTGIKKLIIVK